MKRPKNDLLTQALVKLVQDYLTDDLRRAPYKGNKNKLAGHCYVASEVVFHIIKGDTQFGLIDHSSWTPCFVRHEGAPHWFLRNKKTGEVIDVTARQFKTKVPYEKGVGKGFLTKKPSARARTVLNMFLGIYTNSSWLLLLSPDSFAERIDK